MINYQLIEVGIRRSETKNEETFSKVIHFYRLIRLFVSERGNNKIENGKERQQHADWRVWDINLQPDRSPVQNVQREKASGCHHLLRCCFQILLGLGILIICLVPLIKPRHGFNYSTFTYETKIV